MIDWSAVLHSHVTPEQAQRLAQVHVGLVGAGGLGSNCALLLARCGVRRFTVADHDTVSVSNLNRQFFRPAQVGEAKVAALAKNLEWLLEGSDPPLHMDGHERRIEAADVPLFADCNIVVEAVDDARTKRELVEALLDAGHVVVSASGMAGWGQDMRRRRLGKLTVVGDFTNEVGEGAPPMAPRVMMAAAMQADEVLWRILEHFNIENVEMLGGE